MERVDRKAAPEDKKCSPIGGISSPFLTNKGGCPCPPFEVDFRTLSAEERVACRPPFSIANSLIINLLSQTACKPKCLHEFAPSHALEHKHFLAMLDKDPAARNRSYARGCG